MRRDGADAALCPALCPVILATFVAKPLATPAFELEAGWLYAWRMRHVDAHREAIPFPWAVARWLLTSRWVLQPRHFALPRACRAVVALQRVSSCLPSVLTIHQAIPARRTPHPPVPPRARGYVPLFHDCCVSPSDGRSGCKRAEGLLHSLGRRSNSDRTTMPVFRATAVSISIRDHAHAPSHGQRCVATTAQHWGIAPLGYGIRVSICGSS
jgi:hypothetical protein